jgi:hypothetical protein
VILRSSFSRVSTVTVMRFSKTKMQLAFANR